MLFRSGVRGVEGSRTALGVAEARGSFRSPPGVVRGWQEGFVGGDNMFIPMIVVVVSWYQAYV